MPSPPLQPEPLNLGDGSTTRSADDVKAGEGTRGIRAISQSRQISISRSIHRGALLACCDPNVFGERGSSQVGLVSRLTGVSNYSALTTRTHMGAQGSSGAGTLVACEHQELPPALSPAKAGPFPAQAAECPPLCCLEAAEATGAGAGPDCERQSCCPEGPQGADRREPEHGGGLADSEPRSRWIRAANKLKIIGKVSVERYCGLRGGQVRMQPPLLLLRCRASLGLPQSHGC